jgi:hypothetical protein
MLTEPSRCNTLPNNSTSNKPHLASPAVAAVAVSQVCSQHSAAAVSAKRAVRLVQIVPSAAKGAAKREDEAVPNQNQIDKEPYLCVGGGRRYDG